MRICRRTTRCLLALLLCTAVLCSCSEDAQQSDGNVKETTVDIASPVSIDEAVMRDLPGVYEADDDLSVVTMFLTVSQGNSAEHTDHTWEDINAHSIYYYEEQGLDRYAVEGILQIGDETGPLPDNFGYGEATPNCIVQIRGQTSSRAAQKSYKISIKENKGMWREQATIALNKHAYDSVRFRNKMTYDILKTIPGAFSARTQFVQLYVKDTTTGNLNAPFVDYGLYTQVEQINKRYLRNHGLDNNGQLYKATMFEFLQYDALKPESDPAYNQVAFEEVLEIKGNSNHEKLITMLKDVNNYSVPIEKTFPKYFDEDNYFTWLAFQMLAGNTDTISQNFYLYSPQNGNKWYFISWDNDDAWSFEENATYGNNRGYNYTRGLANYWNVGLHQRVLKSAEYRQKLDDKVEEIRALLTQKRLTDLVADYDKVVRPFLTSMPDQMYAPLSIGEYKNILSMIPKEVEYNYEMYKKSLHSPMPFYTNLPVFSDDQMLFAWDASYDLAGGKVSYTFELASDYLFNNVISRQEELVIPQAFTKELPAGQYFFRITAANEAGETMTVREVYEAADESDNYGVVCFYLLSDGTIRGMY